MRRTASILVACLSLVVVACTEETTPSTSVTTTETTVAEVTSTTHSHETPTTVAGDGPIEREEVMITEDQDYPDGVVIPDGESWVLDPDTSITLTASGNIEVLGALVMQPSSGDVQHVVRFEGIDESAFVGGGMDPVPSDVGLWVMGDGQLLVEGEEKTSWGYEFDLAWAGDEVVAAPNTPGNYTDFEPVTATPPANDLGYPTELLNLTRNVSIEGTPDGYAHVFVRSTQPQTLRFAQIRYVAPTVGESDATGRYGLHIHMSGDGTRGSIIEGVLIRDAGNHAFVPHASHGITFRDTIAYNVLNEPYWWDEPLEPDGDDLDVTNDTNDLIWDRAVAAGVDLGVDGNQFRLSAFYLGNGENVTLTNSVAVGVQGQSGGDRSGFIWPESSESVWTFDNNTAHNNESNGIFVWQNNRDTHVVSQFTAYYNEGAGVNHGAYGNAYQYNGLTLLENGTAAVLSHALGEANDEFPTQTWSDLTTNGGVLVIDEHAREAEVPVLFIRCDFAQVVVEDGDGEEPSEYEFVECDLEPEDFDLEEADSEGVFRVQRADGTAYELSGDGSVTEIDAFYG